MRGGTLYRASKQVIDGSTGQFLYDGFDFSVDENMQKLIETSAMPIAHFMKNMGYKGVAGLDFIYDGKQMLLMEINPRFQSSSRGLDAILREEGKPTLLERQIALAEKLEKTRTEEKGLGASK